MKKINIFGAGIVILLIMTYGTVITVNGTTHLPTTITGFEKSIGGQDIFTDDVFIDVDQKPVSIKGINQDEKIIYYNEEAKGLYELAYIAIDEKTDDEPMDLQSPHIIQPQGFWVRYYTIKAYNIFGWTMFKLCARGYFFGFGNIMRFVFPTSYANVEWWCSWAWSVDYLVQESTMGDDWGRVHAEAGFEHYLLGTVELWAFVQCSAKGSAYGDGGQL
jgi:hypothetical protein